MMSSMTYQDVDLGEVTDLSAEDVEAREVYEENTADTVNSNPLLNFLREFSASPYISHFTPHLNPGEQETMKAVLVQS